jgi:pimeloyl-ACP methyl ester carboxylesterase
VAFVVVQAAPGVTPIEQELYSLQMWLRRLGRFSETEIADAVEFERFAYRVPTTGRWDEYERRRAAASKEPWFGEVSAPDRDSPGHRFWAENGAFDPRPILRQMKVPLLAVFGGQDDVVPTDRSFDVWISALAAAGNEDATLVVFPAAGHELMVESPRGPAGRTHFVSGYFATIRAWVSRLASR